MPKVFISYAHEDANIAESIARIIGEMDIDTFMDVKKISWGNVVLSKVRQALEESQYILVLVSESSLSSQWVPFEVGYAAALRKKILPYVLDKKLSVPAYINELSVINEPQGIINYFSNPSNMLAGNFVSIEDLNRDELLALNMLLQNRNGLEIAELSLKLNKNLYEVDDMMNKLKHLDLTTAHYSQNGGKFWEIDFDAVRLLRGKDEIYLIENRIRGF